MSKKKSNTQLSKLLSYCLRHGAHEMGVNIGSDGFVSLHELLSHKQFKSYSINDIYEVVENSDKKRFEIQDKDNQKLIRAVQGHSIKTIQDEEILQKIEDPDEVPIAYHGTYEKFLSKIQEIGLCKMSRNHIHMATSMSTDQVISGARQNAEVFIEIDISQAIRDGIVFYRSKNNVILSPGLSPDGIIPPHCFKQIHYVKSRQK